MYAASTLVCKGVDCVMFSLFFSSFWNMIEPSEKNHGTHCSLSLSLMICNRYSASGAEAAHLPVRKSPIQFTTTTKQSRAIRSTVYRERKKTGGNVWWINIDEVFVLCCFPPLVQKVVAKTRSGDDVETWRSFVSRDVSCRTPLHACVTCPCL